MLAGVVAAVAVAGYLWLAGEDSATRTADAPPGEVVERGPACPHLNEAFTHNQAGDSEALRRSVAAAATAGEQALQQSGQAFGRSEEIAIELHYSLSQQPTAEDTQRYLNEARNACERVGRWEGTS